MTYLGEYFRVRVAGALRPAAAARMARLHPGVDAGVFRPDPDGRQVVRDRYGLADRPVVTCVSRIVARKGQDTLVRAWPSVLARVPEAALLIVGGGKHAAAVREMSGRLGLATWLSRDGAPSGTAPSGTAPSGTAPSGIAPSAPGAPGAAPGNPPGNPPGGAPGTAAAREPAAGYRPSVYFTGPVPQAELPAHYAAGDVFAMPCRTRRAGLDVEGLGIVYLEASAAGLPVVGGDSGGAPDAILEGETGYVVGGRDVSALSDRLIALLQDPAGARAMGEKGRAWVERDWNWDVIATRLRALIDG